jgi:pimeloyl-ACP methyl ester carboxylesterase
VPEGNEEMSETDRPEIGTTVDAGGVKTNYLEAGEGPAVMLVHGSGPGVTAYANWRLVPPALSRHVYAHCGHWVQIERSPDFNRLVSDFLAGSDG